MTRPPGNSIPIAVRCEPPVPAAATVPADEPTVISFKSICASNRSTGIWERWDSNGRLSSRRVFLAASDLALSYSQRPNSSHARARRLVASFVNPHAPAVKRISSSLGSQTSTLSGKPDIHSLEWFRRSHASVARTGSRPAIAGCLTADATHSGYYTTRGKQPRALRCLAGARTHRLLGTVRDGRRCFVACRAGKTERRLPALNPIEYASTAATKARERPAHLQKRDLRGRLALKPAP